ncbi:MAG: LysR family transcriptional regulator [Planctomycetaceae bacterium]|nr:LysR family transcriptional regulator [Planctomycetaceae bacterium]
MHYFVRVAWLIEEGNSLCEVEKKFDVSRETLKRKISRLEDHFGAQLLDTREKQKKNRLTDAGKKLLDHVKLLAAPDLSKTPVSFAVAASHTLITTDLITPAIADLTKASHLSVRLHLRSENQFDQWIRELQLGELDLLLSFGVPSRLKNFPGIERYEFENQFDVVVVSARNDLIGQVNCNVDSVKNRGLHPLESLRVALLRGDDQK